MTMATSTRKNAYMLDDIDLSSIRNRNEQRVVKALRKLLADMPNFQPDKKDILDIYALALNALPARYAQSGTIVLRDPVREEQINSVVSNAIVRIMERPKP